MLGREEVTGEEGKEEEEEEIGDCGGPLDVRSKGSRGWRSLEKSCTSCDWRRKRKETQRERILFFVLDT